MMIGLFGLNDSGKSTLLESLSTKLRDGAFEVVSGAHKIALLLPNGQEEFRRLDKKQKREVRTRALRYIEQGASRRHVTAIVTADCDFWAEEGPLADAGSADAGFVYFTHIIYLRGMDTFEQNKQDREIAGLRALCEHSSILFSVIRHSNSACERVSTRIRHFLSQVCLIGGGRLSPGNLFLTPKIKGAIVQYLSITCGLDVWAFGDGPSDILMFRAADESILVVGSQQSRSARMDQLLERMNGHLPVSKQILLPRNTTHRPSTGRVPITTLEHSDLVSRITQKALPRVILAPNVNSTLLIRASLRDTSIGIPTLKKVRRQVGWYLAIQHLTTITGLKEALCTHYNGTTGVRCSLRYEPKITIVGIIPNGESMALGVHDVLPMAKFVRTLTLTDIPESHIREQKAVILVDSYIKKDDRTMLNAIKHIRTLDSTIRIMVITGEVLFDLCDQCHELVKLMNQQAVTLIALQASQQEEL